jgi:uncharacterized membrane protein YhaH (DUF805 family)
MKAIECRFRHHQQREDIKVMDNYVSVIKKYAVFSGRAPRKEYWMFFLFNVIISFVSGLLFGALKGMANIDLMMLMNLYSLAVLCPGLAVGVRRLHDTNRSGWWMLLGFIPFIGAIVLIVFLATDGTAGDNKFGPNPRMLTSG